MSDEILIYSDSLNALLLLWKIFTPKMKSFKPFKKSYHTQEKNRISMDAPSNSVKTDNELADRAAYKAKASPRSVRINIITPSKKSISN